ELSARGTGRRLHRQTESGPDARPNPGVREAGAHDRRDECSGAESMMLGVLAVAALALQQPALEDVVVTGDLKAAPALIAGGADVNDADESGVTILMRAASAGRGDMVALLLDKGADAKSTTNGGVNALMMACLGGYMDAVSPLLARKVDPNAKDNQGRTALMAAA